MCVGDGGGGGVLRDETIGDGIKKKGGGLIRERERDILCLDYPRISLKLFYITKRTSFSFIN